jgi:hypothetical protein
MRNWKRLLVVAVTSLVLVIGSAVCAELVCRGPGIVDGNEQPLFSAEAERAKKAIGKETTSEVAECKVYVTKVSDHLYVHSNYVTPDFEYPTKIVTARVRDLFRLTSNVINVPDEKTGLIPADRERKVRDQYKKGIRFYFDQALFSADGSLPIELGAAERLALLFADDDLPKTLVRLHPIRGPPFAAEYHPRLWVKVRSDSTPATQFGRLKDRPLDAAEIRFAALLGNSAVRDAIKTSGVGKFEGKGAVTSKDSLSELFRQNKGRIVVLLGHTDGGDFVATDDHGKPLFKVALSDVERMAERDKCDLVLLACGSGRGEVQLGADRRFNPKLAVERLGKALAAKNYFDFVKTLANEDMGLVFDHSALARTDKLVRADVYAREAGTTEPVVLPGNRLGRLIMAFWRTVVGEKVELKWKFEKDKDGKYPAFYQTMTTETKQTMKIMDDVVVQTQKQTFYFKWKPTKVEADKVTIEQEIIGVKMVINAGDTKIQYDSTATGNQANNPLGDFFKALVGSKFVVTLDTKNSSVSALTGGDDFIKKLAAANPGMRQLLETILSDKALKEMAEPTFAVVPGKAIPVGEKWTKKTELDMGPIGKYVNTYQYELEGSECTGDQVLQKIAVKATLDYQQPDEKQAQGGLPFKIKSAKLESKNPTGNVLFDPKKGRVRSSTMKLELSGDLTIEIGGQTTTVNLAQKQTSTTETSDDDPTHGARPVQAK